MQDDQPANMRQMMQAMMPMMQQMMLKMQGMQAMQGMGGMSMGAGAQAGMSEANKGYMIAMSTMQKPMMAALQSSDPEVAFVKAMIPHHQSAVDMANIALHYAKDEKVKAWANEIIKGQSAEIAQFQEWLKQRGQ